MKFDTKISFDLYECNFSEETGVRIFQTINQILFCLRLINNEYSNNLFMELTNQMSAIHAYMFGNLIPGVGLVNRSEATVTIRFLDTVNQLTAHPTQYI